MSILSKNSYLRKKWREYKERNKNSYFRVKCRAFKQAKKDLKTKLKVANTRKIIESKIKELKKKPRIKVAFLQMYIAECQNFSIFERLLKDNRFDPYFIVNPDVARSEKNFITQYKRTYEELAKKYNGGGDTRVLNGYDFTSNTFIDYTQEFDLMTTANPYDDMAHQYFKISYWTQKHIPIFYISYFYLGRCLVTIDNLKLEALNYVWKFFVENEEVIKLAHKYQIIKGANLVLSGYPKMDSLAFLKQSREISHKKKLKIIIAPHHSIYEADSAIGSFLKYYEILYNVMAKNTDIDFIFRPHPLLFAQLAKDDFWGEAKTQSYFDKVCALDNVTYSTNGDYLEVFADSSALIHDCGSFMAEYLYTHKPCAFLYRDNLNTERCWTEFGRKCVGVHYGIHNAKDLDTFIESVQNGQDSLKEHRIVFAKNEVMINYPNATQKIYENLVQSFSDKKEVK